MSTSAAFWYDQIRKHNARKIKNLADARLHPDQAIAFETINFGWILSSKDKKTGKRKIILKF